VLTAVLAKYGVDKQLDKYDFASRWKEIVGTEVAARTKPDRISHGILFIRVEDSVWAQELSFYQQHILAKIRNALGAQADTVKQIRFCVG